MKISLVIFALTTFIFHSCNNIGADYKQISIRDTSYISKTVNTALCKDLKTHLGENMLPDAKTAVSVAEIYMFNVYGREQIKNERPYDVRKYKNYWLVSGSLPEGAKGGVFYILLDQRDGQVISFHHEK